MFEQLPSKLTNHHQNRDRKKEKGSCTLTPKFLISCKLKFSIDGFDADSK